MIRLTAIVTWLVLCAVPATAQERRASVKLDDGREFQGVVLALDLQAIDLDVGDKILRIPAARIRSCRFEEIPAATGQEQNAQPPATPGTPGEAVPTTEPASAEQGPPATPIGETAAATGSPGEEPSAASEAENATAATATDPKSGEPAGARGDAKASASVQQAMPVPPRLANHSLWRQRLELLDQAYPWLAPSAPTQWISLGLLLLVGSSLLVHMSVNVAGADGARLGRSCGLGITYLIAGLLQVATVPVQDFTVALMLLANTTVALFALCGLFGLLRGQAVIALVVQLGFGVLIYGILELVTALLGSVGVAP